MMHQMLQQSADTLQQYTGTKDLLNRLRQIRVVPVIVIDDPDHAIPLAAALVAGGLPCAEITFRTATAVESLRRIAAEFPDMLVGAGTVLSPAQAAEARDAGAKFVVSPGSNPRVVEHCLEHQIPIFPGVCTPTEIEALLERGIRTVKFFPAEPMGGVAFLKAIAGPYTSVEFMPTGGINAGNLGEYLALKKVVACGGSWMAPAEWIRAEQFERIRQETERTVRAIRTIAGGA
jgi:2-dehydro-3-deoxyphosphogluconate aldolase/(4S)-4-hydroxy-2-oxoglutarate aldolase